MAKVTQKVKYKKKRVVRTRKTSGKRIRKKKN